MFTSAYFTDSPAFFFAISVFVYHFELFALCVFCAHQPYNSMNVIPFICTDNTNIDSFSNTEAIKYSLSDETCGTIANFHTIHYKIKYALCRDDERW